MTTTTHLEQPAMNSLSGVLLIDKPDTISSFRVCRRIRKILDVKRVGHGGTLDPLATGLLIILIGKATRLFDQVMTERKTYSGTIVLGESRDTYDSGGKVMESVEESQLKARVTASAIEKIRQEFLGTIEQVAPRFSALKHKGKPLYKYARKNIEVEPKRRQVAIYSLDLDQKSSSEIQFTAEVGKGTYLRSLAHDFGERLGTYGYLGSLRRLQSGNTHVDRALPFDYCQTEVREEILKNLIPAEEFLEAHESIS